MLSHYTGDSLKSVLENLGGVVRRSVDLQTGEVLEPAGLVGSAPLSTAHKRIKTPKQGTEPARVPFVEYRRNAGYLKVSKAEPTKQTGGGLRGVVKGFSRGSRRRLMLKIQGVDRTASLPCFVTLTYPNSFPEPKQSKYHLKLFIQSMKRAFPMAGIIWKLEPQKRGAPHYHLLVWGVKVVSLRAWVPTAWFDIAGGGDNFHLLWHEGKLKNKNCTQQVNSFNGVMAYASKYLGKTFEVAGWDSKAVGRFWAVVNPDNIPFGELITEPTTRADAVQLHRLQRRFAKLKSRSYPSITIFCDSKQWIEKLGIGGDKK